MKNIFFLFLITFVLSFPLQSQSSNAKPVVTVFTPDVQGPISKIYIGVKTRLDFRFENVDTKKLIFSLNGALLLSQGTDNRIEIVALERKISILISNESQGNITVLNFFCVPIPTPLLILAPLNISKTIIKKSELNQLDIHIDCPDKTNKSVVNTAFGFDSVTVSLIRDKRTLYAIQGKMNLQSLSRLARKNDTLMVELKRVYFLNYNNEKVYFQNNCYKSVTVY